MTDWTLIRIAILGKNHHKICQNIYYFQKLVDICKKHEDVGMFILWLPWPTLIVYGAEAVKFVLNEPSLTDKPARMYKFFDIVDSNTLVRSNGEMMKTRKKIIGPAFYPSILKSMVPAMNKIALSLVEELNELEDNTTKDLVKIMSRKILNLFFETSLGIKLESAEKDSRMISITEVASEFTDYFIHRMFSPWLYFDFAQLFFHEGRKNLKRKKKITLITKEVIEDLKKSHTSRIQSTNSEEADSLFHQPHYQSFGEVLMEEHIKNPLFTLENLGMELLSLIFAGFDSASQSLTWTLWLLGRHEDVQEKAHEEIKLAVGEVIRYEDTHNLKYLECIIKESLRLYPVAPGFARSSNKSLQFGTHTIPRGANISLFIYALHRNPELYPNPQVFNPDRFAESSSSRNPWIHIPFAEGVRSCIGKNYAMLEMKIFLAHIIRNFKLISLTREEDFDLSWKVLLRSSKPLSVKFIPRSISDVSHLNQFMCMKKFDRYYSK